MTTPPVPDPEGPSRYQRLHHHLHRNRAVAATTKLVVTIIGGVVLTGGLIMMVTPGPGLVGIAAGLAILATEWDWADRWLQTARRKLEEAIEGETEEETRKRKKRALITTIITVGTVLVVTVYVWLRDWPGWAVSGWNRAQSVIGFLPELPGM
ncbi:uncharacterized protein (TIGR02611 family) [Marmoricola sp. OAE513]|uniref:PGPGW domain-containing protein n=1 Tax=Marmoricola sp. OAE513 TaxID=2817894 RepID=UPI001AE6D967